MTKLWMAICATVLVGGYGLEAMGQGGGTGGAANNSSEGNVGGNYGCKPSCVGKIPEVAVGAVVDFIGGMISQGMVNVRTSGTWEGRDTSATTPGHQASNGPAGTPGNPRSGNA